MAGTPGCGRSCGFGVYEKWQSRPTPRSLRFSPFSCTRFPRGFPHLLWISDGGHNWPVICVQFLCENFRIRFWLIAGRCVYIPIWPFFLRLLRPSLFCGCVFVLPIKNATRGLTCGRFFRVLLFFRGRQVKGTVLRPVPRRFPSQGNLRGAARSEMWITSRVVPSCT